MLNKQPKGIVQLMQLSLNLFNLFLESFVSMLQTLKALSPDRQKTNKQTNKQTTKFAISDSFSLVSVFFCPHEREAVAMALAYPWSTRSLFVYTCIENVYTQLIKVACITSYPFLGVRKGRLKSCGIYFYS